jgi:hypothetical protein
MWQRFTSLFEHNLELFGTKARVFYLLERGITTKHLKIKVLPAATDPSKFGLALFDREKLHNYFKKWVVNTTPTIFY